MELPEYARLNRDVWTATNAEYTDAAAREAWAREEVMSRGLSTSREESEVGVLGDVPDNLDVIDLGCGTAYVSAWFARRGARPVGDVTPAQLETARRLQAETGLEFPLSGPERGRRPVARLRASTWPCRVRGEHLVRPKLWVAEAARLLRPGGRLIFVCNSPLSIVCSPDEGEVEGGCPAAVRDVPVRLAR